MSIFHTIVQCLRIAWCLMIEFFRLIKGVWKILKLDPPLVTIFGGSKICQKNHYAQQAHRLSKFLFDRGVSIITGGGTGIMQAANCGACGNGLHFTRNIAVVIKGLKG